MITAERPHFGEKKTLAKTTTCTKASQPATAAKLSMPTPKIAKRLPKKGEHDTACSPRFHEEPRRPRLIALPQRTTEDILEDVAFETAFEIMQDKGCETKGYFCLSTTEGGGGNRTMLGSSILAITSLILMLLPCSQQAEANKTVKDESGRKLIKGNEGCTKVDRQNALINKVASLARRVTRISQE